MLISDIGVPPKTGNEELDSWLEQIRENLTTWKRTSTLEYYVASDSDLDDAIDAIGSTASHLWIMDEITLDSSPSLDTNTRVFIGPKGKLTLGSNDITIPQLGNVPLHNWINENGSGVITLSVGSTLTVIPDWFGTTAAAIDRASVVAEAAGAVLEFFGKTYGSLDAEITYGPNSHWRGISGMTVLQWDGSTDCFQVRSRDTSGNSPPQLVVTDTMQGPQLQDFIVDMNNNGRVGLFVEAVQHGRFQNVTVINVPGRTYSYDDGCGAGAKTYTAVGIGVKACYGTTRGLGGHYNDFVECNAYPYTYDLSDTDTYRWTATGTNDEYYCELAGGGDPGFPSIGFYAFFSNESGDSSNIIRTYNSGGINSLSVNEWDWGDGGGGFNTIVYKATGGNDPDTEMSSSVASASKAGISFYTTEGEEDQRLANFNSLYRCRYYYFGKGIDVDAGNDHRFYECEVSHNRFGIHFVGSSSPSRYAIRNKAYEIYAENCEYPAYANAKTYHNKVVSYASVSGSLNEPLDNSDFFPYNQIDKNNWDELETPLRFFEIKLTDNGTDVDVETNDAYDWRTPDFATETMSKSGGSGTTGTNFNLNGAGTQLTIKNVSTVKAIVNQDLVNYSGYKVRAWPSSGNIALTVYDTSGAAVDLTSLVDTVSPAYIAIAFTSGV